MKKQVEQSKIDKKAKTKKAIKPTIPDLTSEQDPMGSYTGNPIEPYDKPEQDVDDL